MSETLVPVGRKRKQYDFPVVGFSKLEGGAFCGFFNCMAVREYQHIRRVKILVGNQHVVFIPRNVGHTTTITYARGVSARFSVASLEGIVSPGKYRIYPYKDGFAINKNKRLDEGSEIFEL